MPARAEAREHFENARYLLRPRSVTMRNPKTEPTDNTQKNPHQGVSDDDPMTGARTSHLKTLWRAGMHARQISGEPD
jgi:hypothetical protein